MATRVNVYLSNLRGIVILIVVAFHSVLPYLASQPSQPFPFDAEPYRWIAFPILDGERWFGFDLFCAWQDVSLMSLMFLLAGLFTPTSLSRKGTLSYLADRWRRIGIPFVFAVGILSPLAYFASYRVTAADPSATAFWQHWQALPMWPSGPQWFLWQLFLLSALAACIQAFAAPQVDAVSRTAGRVVSDRPLIFVIGLTVLSTLAYVPLAMAFTPWTWTYFGPFSFQLSRPLQYVLYFFAGYAIGSYGYDRSVLRPGGPVARHWLLWLAVAVTAFAAWGALTSRTLPDWDASPLVYRLAAAFAFPVACATGVLCLFGISLRLMQTYHRLLDSISTNAYGIYLLHYVFVVWLQYAVLAVDFHPIGKAAIVFACALLLSWSVGAGMKSLILRYAAMGKKGVIASQAR